MSTVCIIIYLLHLNFIARKISSLKSFILKSQLCSGCAVYVCVLDVRAEWSAWMKSLFVQFGLTGSDYPGPNVTLLRVRFVSSLGWGKFDLGALTICPQCRRSSCLCRWGRCFAGRWWNRAEPNRTEPGRLTVNDCWRKTRNEMMFVWILILLLGSHERALGNGEFGLKITVFYCFTKTRWTRPKKSQVTVSWRKH